MKLLNCIPRTSICERCVIERMNDGDILKDKYLRRTFSKTNLKRRFEVQHSSVRGVCDVGCTSTCSSSDGGAIVSMCLYCRRVGSLVRVLLFCSDAAFVLCFMAVLRFMATY